MWKLILKYFCLFAVLGNLNAAFGLPVEIISQEYHVWGHVSNQSYDISSSTPVSGSCQEYLESSGGGWVTESSSTLGSSIDFISVDSSSQSLNPWTLTQANAEAIYVFKPTTDALQIEFTGQSSGHYFENWGYFTLENLDASVVLDSRKWEYEPGVGWTTDILPYSGIYNVLLEDQYRLTVGVNGALPDFRLGHMHLEATIIPEPATILLFGLGAAWLCAFRKTLK
jgi:hypothetical protein